jgi:hypothetical protein
MFRVASDDGPHRRAQERERATAASKAKSAPGWISRPNFRRNAVSIIDARGGAETVPIAAPKATTSDRDREWAWNCHKIAKTYGTIQQLDQSLVFRCVCLFTSLRIATLKA